MGEFSAVVACMARSISALYLVEKFCGREIALKCAKSLLVSMPRSSQSGYSVLPLSRPHFDDKIKLAEQHLQKHFDRNVSLEWLADRVGMGPRNFIRRFKAATGRLPGQYTQLLRVSAAREMLEHGAGSIQSVCSKTGYEDLAFFRSVFKRHTGMTPAEYRSSFAGMTIDRGDLASRRPAAIGRSDRRSFADADIDPAAPTSIPDTRHVSGSLHRAASLHRRSASLAWRQCCLPVARVASHR